MKEHMNNIDDEMFIQDPELGGFSDDFEQMASLDEMLADLPDDFMEDMESSESNGMTLEEFDALVGFSEESSLGEFEVSDEFEASDVTEILENAQILQQEESLNLEQETDREESMMPKMASDIYSESLSAVTSLEEEALEKEFNSLLPDVDETKEIEKQPSLMQKMFANIEPDNAEEEIAAAKEAEEQKEALKKKKAEEKEKKKEEKKKAADEKKAAKAAAKEAKTKAKEELKAKKLKEKQEMEKSYVPEGKINKVGASIVGATAVAAGIVIVSGTVFGTKSLTVSSAKFAAKIGRTAYAYEELSGLDLNESDQKLYDKLKTVMYMQKQKSSYDNFKELGMEVEALDSLLKGVERYNEYYAEAEKQGVADEYDQMKSDIIAELNKTYHVDETRAKELVAVSDNVAYTKSLHEICSSVTRGGNN